MRIGYARVSTTDQNLDPQTDALDAAGCEKIFSDHGVSGTKTERPGLDKALDQIRKGDILVIWKLDRLGRSLSHLLSIIEDLKQKGVDFASVQDGFDTSTASGKAQLLSATMHKIGEDERKPMFAREWKCICPRDTEGSFLNYLQKTGAKDTQSLKGCTGHQILRRSLEVDIEITFATFWQSLESMKEYSGQDLYRAVLYSEDEAFKIRPDKGVKVYEVVYESLFK